MVYFLGLRLDLRRRVSLSSGVDALSPGDVSALCRKTGRLQRRVSPWRPDTLRYESSVLSRKGKRIAGRSAKTRGIKDAGGSRRVYSGETAGCVSRPRAQGSIMPVQTKSASTITSGSSAYTLERRTHALVLETADALRAEQRRVSFASIDSNASKWRYSVASVKG